LNEVVGAYLYGDGQRLCYVVFPHAVDDPATVRIQQRRINADDTIIFKSPAPAGAGLSGAELIANGMVEFKLPRR
jgi:hypothetical protein